MPRARPARPRRTRFVLVLLLVVFVNLPLAHTTWTRWRVEQSGVVTTADVTRTQVQGSDEDPAYFVEFTYPEDVDPDREVFVATVDEQAYDAAEAADEIEVRHLEDRVSAYTVDGEVRSNLGVVITVFGDVVLLVVLLMAWRLGGPRRPWVRVVAVGDVERCPPGALLEREDGMVYLVRGEVVTIEDDEIVLDVGDRDVHVVLDGHLNPVGFQQPAQVRGRMVD